MPAETVANPTAPISIARPPSPAPPAPPPAPPLPPGSAGAGAGPPAELVSVLETPVAPLFADGVAVALAPAVPAAPERLIAGTIVALPCERIASGLEPVTTIVAPAPMLM